jgi:hydroxyjasmonate sulfotransferase
MATEEFKLKPRPPWSEFPNIEDVDAKYRDLILTLPFEQQWAMRQYQGFWEIEKILPGFLRMQEFFKPRPSDIILASFPKSGTTWLKSLVFTIVHRNKYAFSSHPLLTISPHDCVHQLESMYNFPDKQDLDIFPSPRVLGTHAAFSMLPESVNASKCPIIYICRETKDVLVSFWHMLNTIAHADSSFAPPSFAQAFESFCSGQVPYGPIWDHILEYYKESLQNPDKILFLRYEEVMNDPIDVVIRLANFTGNPFSEEEVTKGVVEEIVKLCSFDKLTSLNVNKKKNDVRAPNHMFFRKAIVGDWQNHMTDEMAAKLDEIIKEKFEDSGFSF